MADRPKSVGDVLGMMKDKDVKFLDLRFTDTKGKMQHVTADGSVVNEGMFADGFAFDGSSIAGWKGIEASDMTLMPDPASAHIDPFFAQTTMAIFCDVLEPSTGEMYDRDPRSIAKRAEAYLKQTGVGDVAVFDVYAGAGIEPGKKSVALAVTLQPTERTLTEAEIEAVAAKIVANVVKQTGARLRS